MRLFEGKFFGKKINREKKNIYSTSASQFHSEFNISCGRWRHWWSKSCTMYIYISVDLTDKFGNFDGLETNFIDIWACIIICVYVCVVCARVTIHLHGCLGFRATKLLNYIGVDIRSCFIAQQSAYMFRSVPMWPKTHTHTLSISSSPVSLSQRHSRKFIIFKHKTCKTPKYRPYSNPISNSQTVYIF